MKATFAAGCFWHVEALFRKIPGVIDATVGYTGGNIANPTYEEVCTDGTGHAEAVQVEYDPETVSYSRLLEIFWKNHDPTSLNRQGPDVGTQYRSAIFCHDQSQIDEAKRSKQELQKKSTKEIVTQISPAPEFYRAEDYHQRYFEKNSLV